MKGYFFVFFLLASVALAGHEKLKDVRFPNYLVPLNQSSPNTPHGTRYTGNIKWTHAIFKDEISLIVGFDVPENGATSCYLKFTLPGASSDSWRIAGSRTLDYYGLSRPVNHKSDTWNIRPQRAPPHPLGQIQIYDGADGVVTGGIPCNLGTRMDFELAVHKPAEPMEFEWYELIYPKTGITLEMYGPA